MRNKNTPTNQENIEAEQLLLLDIQTEHGAQLDALGITKKAMEVSGDDSFTDLTRASVALLANRDQEGKIVEIPCIRFSTPSISPSGHNTTSAKYVDVAGVEDDTIELRHDFTLSEAEAVINMLAGLKEAKDMGVLPHLSADLTTINNPRANLMQLPKVTAKHRGIS